MGEHKPTPPGSHVVRPRVAQRGRVFWLGRPTPGTGDLKQVVDNPTAKMSAPSALNSSNTEDKPTAQGPTVDERMHDSFARRLESITPPPRKPTRSAVRPPGQRGRVEVKVVVPSAAPTIASSVVHDTKAAEHSACGAHPIIDTTIEAPPTQPSEPDEDFAHLMEPTGKFQMIRERFARDPVLMSVVVGIGLLLLVLCVFAGLIVFRQR